MRSNYLKAALKTAVLAVAILLLTAGISSAQSVNLTASRQTTTLPDGSTVPMWGWTCSSFVAPATCTALTYNTTTGLLNPQTGGTTWQPPLITVPAGSGLSIALTNSLPVETSLVIVGQLGDGLGVPARESAPRTNGAHAGQSNATWPIPGGSPDTFTPPAQGQRARSFGVEVPAGQSHTYTWSALKPGTYLIQTGTYPSIQGPMGLYGVLVVTTAPVAGTGGAAGTAGTAYPGVFYDSDAVLLLSGIDPVQNAAADAAAQVVGLDETAPWTPTCGATTPPTCYPAAVNYTPLYSLVNGLSYSKNAPLASALTIPGPVSTAGGGNVLLRFANADSHMHVPAAVGLNFSLIAEDGNIQPDVALAISKAVAPSPKLQSEVFLAAGKVFDVFVKPSFATGGTALAGNTYGVFDRSLSLSTNNQRDGGMQAYLVVAGGNTALGTGGVPALGGAVLHDDAYSCASGVTLNVTDPGKGVIANDVNVYGVTLGGNPPQPVAFGGGTLTLNPNGTFTYTQPPSAPNGTSCGGMFSYYANGNPTLTATVTISPSGTLSSKPVANDDSYTSTVSSTLKMKRPGVLANDYDLHNYPLTAVLDGNTCGPVTLNSDGSFTAIAASPGSPCSFTYHVVNSENQRSNGTANVTLTFPAGSGLQVTVQDAQTKAPITDYKWIIEQDLTFYIDPACQQNGPGGSKPATCPAAVPPTLGTNFHSSYMPVIAVGCTGPQSCERDQTVYNPATGGHDPAVCDNGICTSVPSGSHLPTSTPAQAVLNATNPDGTPARYYISVLPGDAANPFNTANASDPSNPANCAAGQTPVGGPGGAGETVSSCGHTMGGAPIAAPIAQVFAPVTVNVEPTPLRTATVTLFVFEDDFPTNGEPDTGGGVDSFPTQEAGLEDFQVILWDLAGNIAGDATGQMTYDMFNMPLTNALNGTVDPITGNDACPISNTSGTAVGVIIVCPKYESDGVTLSPLVGQVVIKNLMPGLWDVAVHPGAKREAAGEEWLQTNTLDGSPKLDAFVKAAEPAYFQEYGPGGYHVFFGMANPKIINARLPGICNTAGAPACHNTVHGQTTNLHQGRSPDERLFTSGVFPQGDPRNYAPLNYTTCWATIGDTDGITFGATKCDADGNFTFTGIPDGSWGVTVFDQWNDLLVDGSSRSITVKGGQTLNMEYGSFTWQAHLWSKTYMDLNGNGIQDPGEPGVAQVPTRIRMRNGRFNNTLFTDIDGNTHFDETFPTFNWYVTESDSTRFRSTGVHVVNDAGGPVDGPAPAGNGTTAGPYQAILNSKESFPLPSTLRVPGAYYCTSADCSERAGIAGRPPVGGSGGSTGRIDPGAVLSEGWQGGVGQFDIFEWGKLPYVPGETGGIRGHVANSTTRPFDDPGQLFQNLWEPLVPRVTVNLYKEGTTPEGATSLTLVDTTKTSSWDDWAQGFRADGVTPNMSCPGEDVNDPFFSYTLAGTRNYLNPNTVIPYNSQYKCFDGYHNLNQAQPAPYDGLYVFPSPFCANNPGGTFIAPSGQTITCATVPNPALNAAVHTGAAPAVLPPAKYVTEVVVPPGYELTKEEDKNILIGDMYIAPVSQQFAGLGDVFIIPDQATINNGNPAFGSVGGPATNPTTDFGRSYIGGFGPGGLIVQPAPCVGTLRIVPDYMSISPESGEVAPFAGASRNLCDRKELTLEDQMQAQADFFIWTKTPAASHFTGFITDDFASEFDPANPAFGEKFAVTNVPIGVKDYNGVEISRMYADQWGTFNGLVYSSWQVNPPNPTGYSPNVMIFCMNDPGPIPGPNGTTVTDPAYNPSYSNFCYEWSLMPADTAYLDTPVVPTAAFAEGYNPPDCAYPDATPAVKEVDGDGIGPWVSAAGSRKLTITALGDQLVPNHAYSGPAANSAPYNLKTITRHYGFGTAPAGGCSNGNPNAACPSVTVAGIPLHGVTWNDTTITGIVQANVPPCAIQQRGTGNAGARCGELVITAANGKQSIDTVTVTIGGKAPTRLAAGQSIQSAIDAAAPGDLIIVPPGTYNEMLLMWKPVRLQGVGAASTIVDANTQPAGQLLDPWRRRVDCLFGLALNGGLIDNSLNSQGQPKNPYDPTGTYSCSSAYQVDPIPLEPIIGWVASLNGNIAELLQEPSLMGAYEGAAITVLGRGWQQRVLVTADTGGTNNAAGTFDGTLLTNSAADCQYVGNFLCNPSRIDGMGFRDSSQGGGGIFLHGWNHYTEVSNNRVYNNGGTLAGGIVVGQAETPPATIAANNVQLPFLFNHDVYMHHNSVTHNSAYGDELNSNTPAAAGGVTLCDGSDYYRFNYNWVCGNLSMGDGGGVAHFGFSWNGDIEHNSIVFNQSTNPTLTTYGGGLIAEGVGPDGTLCENSATFDLDCPPQLSDGIGPGLVINANLIQGNTAEGGSGGGLRLQHLNGTEVQRNPNNPAQWYEVTVTNNIIVNNVAGWGGGGVSLLDALRVNFINNTVASNDNTATAGVLFDSPGAPNANVPPPGCDPTITPPPAACSNTSVTVSNPMVAGLQADLNSGQLSGVMTNPNVNCPNHPNCTKFSNPLLENNLFWQNRTFHITTGAIPAPGLETTVQLVPALQQTTTGACPSGATYWDIGVYGDTSASNHGSGFRLSPSYSILTDASDYPGAHNSGSNPNVGRQYCNGSRVPPEIAPGLCSGPNGNANAQGCVQPGTVGISLTVPPGITDSTYAGPAFSLTPAATVDEGSNWINMFYGPLALSNPVIQSGGTGYGVPLGDYSITSGSPAFNAGTSSGAPTSDFFGTTRPQAGAWDIGAVEVVGTTVAAPTLTSIVPNTGAQGAVVPVTLTGTNLTGATAVNVSGTGVTVSGITVVSATSITATFTIAGNATVGARTVSATTPGGTSNTVTFTVAALQGTLSFTSATNGTLATLLGARTLTFTIPTVRAPVTSIVTVANTGAAPLQITAENLLVNIGGLYTVPANTCSFTTPLGVGSTCTFSVRYATPATQPALPDVGALAVRNNGSGTVALPAPPYTPLALVAR